MIDAYLAAMRRYVTFTGRASRSDYWWSYLSVALLTAAALVADGMFMAVADLDSAVAPFTSLVVVAHGLPMLAVGVRRLHDMDRSGWFYLVGLLPLIGPIVLLVWFCQPGTPGANGFGSDPLATPDTVAPSSSRPLAAAARDIVGDVERLAGLRASGALSEAEFATLKTQVVGGAARA